MYQTTDGTTRHSNNATTHYAVAAHVFFEIHLPPPKTLNNVSCACEEKDEHGMVTTRAMTKMGLIVIIVLMMAAPKH